MNQLPVYSYYRSYLTRVISEQINTSKGFHESRSVCEISETNTKLWYILMYCINLLFVILDNIWYPHIKRKIGCLIIMCWVPISNLWTWLAMETDMGPVGRVRISPCRTGHTVSIHPHYGPEIQVNFWVAAKKHSGVRANLTVLKLLAIKIMHLMSIGH